MNRVLDLELREGYKYRLSKEVFKHPNLSISSVRLLIVLSTKKGLTVEGMNRNTKLWIIGSKNEYSTIQSLSDELVELGLINANGAGLDLKKDFIKFNDISEIESCRNLRQIFTQSLKYWTTKNEIKIDIDIFKGLFGETTRLINRNLKSARCEYPWIEKHNKIVLFKHTDDKPFKRPKKLKLINQLEG